MSTDPKVIELMDLHAKAVSTARTAGVCSGAGDLQGRAASLSESRSITAILHARIESMAAEIARLTAELYDEKAVNETQRYELKERLQKQLAAEAELKEARKDAPRERAKSVNVQAFLKASTVEVFSDGPQQGELTGRMKSALELVELWRETADLFRRRYRQALEVIELVRGHPDFDQGGVMAEAMDAVLNHEEPKILATLESIANGRMPPADAAMAKETQHGRPE